jgi:peptidoglycan/LPS O-acetylase OafA/YrhL
VRSVFAVIAGYLIFAVCSFALFRFSGHDPHADASLQFKLVTILCGMVFALAGGYVTGRLAPGKPAAHGIALAILMALFAGISMFTMPAKGNAWTQISAIFLMAPAAIGGSLVATRFRESTT